MQHVPDQPLQALSVQVDAGEVMLAGELVIPPHAAGIVLFAHGSGSSRLSPRNQLVAQYLQQGGMATLLFDLLTADEEAVDQVTRHLRFDIELLATRLIAATDWVLRQPDTSNLAVGYFGSSTGAAAALISAAQRQDIAALVSRGGRPDLALPVLHRVNAPALLIVGGNDKVVIQMNEQALARLRCEARLKIVPGASHLFAEPGALETVSVLAQGWFRAHFGPN